MPGAALKAWKVEYPDDYEGRTLIVHAETRGSAKDWGCGELDCDFVDVRAKRAPQFDGLLGDALIRAQLDDGWWFQCFQCERRVGEDEWNEDDEQTEPGEEKPPRNTVIRFGDVYCSSACSDARLCDIRRFRENEWGVVADALEKWPGIEIVDRDGITFGNGENKNAIVGHVRFRFPGQKYGACGWCRYDEMVMVPNGDAEDWDRFSAHCRELKAKEKQE